jgi:hypothetical protein
MVSDLGYVWEDRSGCQTNWILLERPHSGRYGVTHAPPLSFPTGRYCGRVIVIIAGAPSALQQSHKQQEARLRSALQGVPNPVRNACELNQQMMQKRTVHLHLNRYLLAAKGDSQPRRAMAPSLVASFPA